jgi:hypothetical protein
LGAVAEIAFQLTTLGIAGLHNADPGRSQLVEMSECLGLQPLVLQRQPEGGPDRPLSGTAAVWETTAILRPSRTSGVSVRPVAAASSRTGRPAASA